MATVGRKAEKCSSSAVPGADLWNAKVEIYWSSPGSNSWPVDDMQD